MIRALLPLGLIASIVLSACTVHIHPGTPTQGGAAPPPEEEEQEQPAVTPEEEPERQPEPVVPRRRPQPEPEPEPPPRQEPERRQPIVPQPPVGVETRQVAWACHGDGEPVWVAISVGALEFHRQHGDSVSTEEQVAGEACRRVAVTPPGGRRPEPREPDRPIPQEPVEGRPERVAWVCHGEENPLWLRVSQLEAQVHRRHGDPLTVEPQTQGTPCERGGEPREPRQPEPPDRPPPDRPPPEEPPPRPERPEPQQFAWVCHGEQNPQWLRVAVPSVAAHREHGDPVSTEPREPGTACERGEPEAPPDRPPPQEPPPRPEQPGRQRFVWVCHGAENPQWLRVAAPSAEAHREHGDPVSLEPREAGTACERGEPETPPEEPRPEEPRPERPRPEQPRPEQPRPEQPQPEQPPPRPEPQTPDFVWVCHGQRNPTWLRVATASADAHRQHGDPVSTEPQEVGTPCERGGSP